VFHTRFVLLVAIGLVRERHARTPNRYSPAVCGSAPGLVGAGNGQWMPRSCREINIPRPLWQKHSLPGSGSVSGDVGRKSIWNSGTQESSSSILEFLSSKFKQTHHSLPRFHSHALRLRVRGGAWSGSICDVSEILNNIGHSGNELQPAEDHHRDQTAPTPCPPKMKGGNQRPGNEKKEPEDERPPNPVTSRVVHDPERDNHG